MLWNKQEVREAQRILRKHENFQDAITAISRALGSEVSAGALRAAFQRHGAEAPSSYLTEATQKDFGDLVRLVKGPTPVSFETVCDRLNLPPSKAKDLIKRAKLSGLKIHVENDHVGLRVPDEVRKIQTVGVAPVVGETQKIGHISDLHLGSKYCLRAQLKDCVQHFYDQGVRVITCTGDVLDGMYRHGVWELSHTGLDEQCKDLYETLPQLPGLTYHSITGNHDDTFTQGNGVDVGSHIRNYFRDHGRKDLSFYGDRGAFLKVGGALIHLWHPRSGGAYAKSYPVQKQIEKYSPGQKPDILLCGHWHTFCYIEERGIHGIACPTFQGGGSAFSKSLGGAPSIGGLLLSWDLTAHGTLRNFTIAKRSYYEMEKEHRIA